TAPTRLRPASAISAAPAAVAAFAPFDAVPPRPVRYGSPTRSPSLSSIAFVAASSSAPPTIASRRAGPAAAAGLSAATAPPPLADRIHVPTLIGEVTLKTRSML